MNKEMSKWKHFKVDISSEYSVHIPLHNACQSIEHQSLLLIAITRLFNIFISILKKKIPTRLRHICISSKHYVFMDQKYKIIFNFLFAFVDSSVFLLCNGWKAPSNNLDCALGYNKRRQKFKIHLCLNLVWTILKKNKPISVWKVILANVSLKILIGVVSLVLTPRVSGINALFKDLLNNSNLHFDNE